MFEFDPAKSATNQLKHGIDFETAQELWRDDLRLAVDTRYVDEARQLVIGRIGKLIWTAVVTQRGDAVRIISVRRARDEEVKAYEAKDN